MPAPAHVHMVLSGTLKTGEIFAVGWDTLGEAGNQATLDQAVGTVIAFMTTVSADRAVLLNLLNPTDKYTKVTGYSYAAGAPTASLVSSLPLNVAGTGGGNNPNQLAIVATLRTAIPSRRTRGRMFMPATGIAVGAGALMTAPTPAELAHAVASLINTQGQDIAPVVISRAGGLGTPITAVSVDNKVDTQRRRANKVVATVVATSPVA